MLGEPLTNLCAGFVTTSLVRDGIMEGCGFCCSVGDGMCSASLIASMRRDGIEKLLLTRVMRDRCRVSKLSTYRMFSAYKGMNVFWMEACEFCRIGPRCASYSA